MPRQRVPTVFLSSTVEDLKPYREAANAAAQTAGFLAVAQEYWVARDNPPLKECMERVAEADVLVVIVAHRHGWVPPGQPAGARKSITRLECEEAKRLGQELLAFVVDDAVAWDFKLREEHLLGEAAKAGKGIEEAVGNVAALAEFKEWLRSGRTRVTFTNPDDLRGKISDALNDWRSRHPEFGRQKPQNDPLRYLAALREETAHIDIRGLVTGAPTAHRFPIEALYIPLRSTGKERDVPLDEALQQRRLVITGDAGSGKTTFLRRIAHQRCAATTVAAFPILIRMAKLEEHIHNVLKRADSGAPTIKESPDWLAHFLASRAAEHAWGLEKEFFREKLREESTLLLLDGLDEATSRTERESIARLVDQTRYGCRIVVTTRPRAYVGKSKLADFEEVAIGDLNADAVDLFLRKWTACLYPENATAAGEHQRQLLEALRAKPEIRRMARNPIMLTALAVVHWNEKRLPEQRAELYESILSWLARAREQEKKDRESAERCLILVSHLALAMQSAPGGRVTEFSKAKAAEAIAPKFRAKKKAEAEELRRARLFLDQEEIDSGIVVSRGSQVRFWHLTFQEYLAGRALAGLPDAAQHEVLLRNLYLPEWREMVLLLAGTLVKQGPEKVDALLAKVLDQLGEGASLPDQARAAGLMGAILADLRPAKYELADGRYQALLDRVLDIFDAGKASQIPLKDRLDAAEALGQAGDPRLRGNNWAPIAEGPHGKAFKIGRYPVTVAEYRRFLEDDGYSNPAHWTQGGFEKWKEPDDWVKQEVHRNWPVTGVSWFEAAAYCAWDGGFLPAEEQWEFAARGAEGRKYPWGKEEPDAERANYYPTGPRHPTPVGLYPKGATPDTGIHDMAGNVWEWVRDWYDKKKELRVLRGGSCFHVSSYLVASGRIRGVPEGRSADVGFRCAQGITFLDSFFFFLLPRVARPENFLLSAPRPSFA